MITRNVAQYPLRHVTYPASKFEVATPNRLGGETVTRKYIFFIFDYDLGVMVTRNVTQYLLHHVTYPAAKFEVATSYRLGGEIVTRKNIN